MLRRDLSGATPHGASHRRTVILAAGAAVILAGGTAAGLAAAHSGARHGSPSRTHLIGAACGGPAGAAYVSDAGWDGFSAINTATCKVIQTYNVGDRQVPGDPGDQDFDSTNEGVAIHGSTLYFADAGNSTVAVINTKDLDPKNFNPPEKLINVGLFPQSLAVTPDGKQVWSADTGPQTSRSSPSGISVISTASDKVVAKLPLSGTPTSVAFSPSGSTAYVATSQGLWIYSTHTRQVLKVIHGLGEPRSVAVSPDGQKVYVTATDAGAVAVINAANDTVARTIKVGELPWQVIVSADGDRRRDRDGEPHRHRPRRSRDAGPDPERPAVVGRAEQPRHGSRARHGQPRRRRRYPARQLWGAVGRRLRSRRDRPRHHPDARVVAWRPSR
jgi:YVTN family beta-propeller protein